jgi:hypothetical protein
MRATFFAIESGTDAGSNRLSRTDKTALDVQYTGTNAHDLVIYQGAGRSIISINATSTSGSPATNNADKTTGFSFDATSSPEYATVSTSNYITNINAIDFAKDAVLSQTTPAAPDLSKLDDSPCGGNPTTVLQYIDKPEQISAFSTAMTSCNSTPLKDGRTMCDRLRNLEHMVNEAMEERRIATGSATGIN